MMHHAAYIRIQCYRGLEVTTELGMCLLQLQCYSQRSQAMHCSCRTLFFLWLKCNMAQGNAGPPPIQKMAQGVLPAQISYGQQKCMGTLRKCSGERMCT